MTDTTPSHIQLVQDTYAAFGRGDIDAVLAAMHPDIGWHEAEHSPWHTPGGHHGPTEVLAPQPRGSTDSPTLPADL